MGLKKCPNPGCGDAGVETDHSKGTSYCTGCGRVLEENATVTEVTFAEGTQGQVLLVGQHVGTDGKIYTGMRLPGEHGDEAASFLKHGRQDINTLKGALNLRKTHAEEALSLFRIALQRNFVKGRRIMYVACACLYTVCRTMESPHMLIDFSEVIKANVFKIGAVFLQFIKVTNIRLPLNDPSLYIHRFVGQLKFGEQTPRIANSSLRLIARMKRDWMCTGRRPSGLCGAAIIIASRMHNFFRSKDEVVRVVKVGVQTLQKRLYEFRDSHAAFMTAEEIEKGGGEDGRVESIRDANPAAEENPPCLKERALRLVEELKETDVQKPGKGVISGRRLRKIVALKKRKQQQRKLETDSESEDEKSNAANSETDEDVSMYLNTEKEEEVKTMLWEAANKDYLERQEQMEKLRMENPDEFKRRYPWRVVGERAKTKQLKLDSSGATDSAAQILEAKSSKINYDVLRSMLADSDDDAAPQGAADTEASKGDSPLSADEAVQKSKERSPIDADGVEQQSKEGSPIEADGVEQSKEGSPIEAHFVDVAEQETKALVSQVTQTT